LFILLLLTQSASAAIQITNEFWICTNSGTADLGTLSDPFDGSTASKFDSRMSSIPANSTIHILAGTYQTFGNSAWLVKSGQKILGSGIDVTIVKLAAGTPSNIGVIGSAGSGSNVGTNMEVSDLTADCNYTSGSATYHGVSLAGTRNAVRRVKVINTHYSVAGGNSEAWGISVSGGFNTLFNSDGNIIEECEVSSHQGGAISAIAMNGNSGPTYWVSGIIRNNRVFLPAGSNVCCGYFGINGAYTYNWLIEGNYVEGGSHGLYGDTGGYTNIVVAHNTFKNCFYGVGLQGTIRQNMTFAFNTIELNPNPYVYNAATAFEFYGNGYYTNIVIVGNHVGLNSAPVAGPVYYFLLDYNVSGLMVANNTVDSTFYNYVSGCSGINVYNNVDLKGNHLATINQVEPPNALTRTTVNAATYNVGYTDRYIGIKTTGTTVNVNLPSAVGWPGKEYIIAKEISNGNTVNINATSPDKINGVTSLNFSGSYAVRNVISDGTNWFSR